MHNLAIALKLKGYDVNGSDDEIFEPSRGRLDRYGILPEKIGWDASRIHRDLDAVILGMHAKEDNPELLRARELGLKIFSYPEYLYEASKDKTRVVIAGSHGKTTITSIILHVLQSCGIKTDYMVGAKLDGFEVMVKLSDDAKYIILEGDEYLSSPLDRRPKFHLYKPDIALLSGIAWDHMNVFPTFEDYVSQFEEFLHLVQPGGFLIYCKNDPIVKGLAAKFNGKLKLIPYGDMPYQVFNSAYHILYNGRKLPLKVFGKHNMENIDGAWKVCKILKVDDENFLKAISSFGGASNRLQPVGLNESTAVYKDFAHSPSKLKATIQAVKEFYPDRELVACIELHTYSSLNKNFLPQYQGCMKDSDHPLVYYNPHALQLKRLPPLNPKEIIASFSDDRITVYHDREKLMDALLRIDYKGKNLLMMSSGDFDGIDLGELAKSVLQK
jgi:UDP-N-acetylmuramate: L-alanyl-gamma-D-glutamyl-meso-diaminopimelate ligase